MVMIAMITKQNAKSHSANAWLDRLKWVMMMVDMWRRRRREKKPLRYPRDLDKSPVAIDTSQHSTSIFFLHHSMQMQWQSAAHADKQKQTQTS
jgi:hypothetical protein